MSARDVLGFSILVASVVLLAISFGPFVSAAYCVCQGTLYLVHGGRL